MVAEPEFTVVDIEKNDDFILLACDGLFDVMSSQDGICICPLLQLMLVEAVN